MFVCACEGHHFWRGWTQEFSAMRAAISADLYQEACVEETVATNSLASTTYSSLDSLLWTWGAICQTVECGQMRLGGGIGCRSKLSLRFDRYGCLMVVLSQLLSCSEACQPDEIGSVLFLPK